MLERQGEHEEAEKMYREVLKLREKVLGAEHPDTLDTLQDLAYLIESKRQFDEAKLLYEKALSGYQRTLGPNHPDAVSCSENYKSMLEEMNNICPHKSTPDSRRIY